MQNGFFRTVLVHQLAPVKNGTGMPDLDGPKLLTMQQACRSLGLSVSALKGLMARKVIAPVYLTPNSRPKFDPKDIDGLIVASKRK